MDVEKLLVQAAMLKWVEGEPMSSGDVRRVINVLNSGLLDLDRPQQEDVVVMQEAMVNTLEQWTKAVRG